MKPKYELEGDVILKDGHTMFFEDVVRDLNYYSGKYLDLKETNQTKPNEVYVVFEERLLSCGEDNSDGYVILYDGEEIGRNLSTIELINKIKDYDEDVFGLVKKYLKEELRCSITKDKDILDSLHFKDVCEFLEKHYNYVLRKYDYQVASFVDTIYKTEEQAKAYIQDCKDRQFANKRYYNKYVVR